MPSLSEGGDVQEGDFLLMAKGRFVGQFDLDHKIHEHRARDNFKTKKMWLTCDARAFFGTEFPGTLRADHISTVTMHYRLHVRVSSARWSYRFSRLFPLSNWDHPHNTPHNGSINIKTKLHQPHPDSSALLVLQASHDFALGPHHFSPWRRTGRPGQCSCHDFTEECQKVIQFW